ncbi:unnamed protein product [Hermetia illucens]|uniref:Dynein regulatory complex protein 10 n=1 Tax=Hermetia illucens TaxID=343691 RepID=A0A7R8UWW9_HERIL|nr:unnamed protein product [Hermetia illucens]
MSFRTSKSSRRSQEQIENGSRAWEQRKSHLDSQQIEDNAKDVTTFEEAQHKALVNRIFNIMKLTQERVQVALMIPHLLGDQNTGLNRFLSSDEKNELRRLCEKYLQSDDLGDMNDSEKSVMIDYELINAIDLIHKNKELLEHIPYYIKCLPESSQNFMNAMNDLKTLTEARIKTSARTEIEKEKMLHQICHENEKMDQKIEGKGTANERMAHIYAKSEERQQELREEAAKSKQAYENLLLENIRADKKLRERKIPLIPFQHCRARILTQLNGWIKKYDNDIGDRTREVNRLDAELAEKTADFDEFMKLYEKQEVEYNAILQMREAEDKKLQEEKMILFMMNRAAKLIQKKWREYMHLKKKKAKGKGRKGKK